MNLKVNVNMPQLEDGQLYMEAYFNKIGEFFKDLFKLKFINLASKVFMLICVGLLFTISFSLYEISTYVYFPFNYILKLTASTWIIVLCFLGVIILLEVMAEYLDIKFNSGSIVQTILGKGMYPPHLE
ncbi:Transmembrane domain-containing protein [Spironucleus salmonicida]|uniref:Transmembrane domain-containing protein n=1 Tax=Spironucleus salmonicida TaxID=348837 RepID=V6LUR4_9EUKA|nr:Transmembrane domain-containing protein [Spironucleus salmonicida]|eukprot:EST44549.1 Transmembrane domain-containing protein [Spironucleus salmonicida]